MAQAAVNMTSTTHQGLANSIRFLSIDSVQQANSGHPGMPMGMADIATVLFQKFLKFDPKNPEWPDRDRFVLSNGHGAMLLYALNYLTGYEGMTLDQLKNFRKLGSHTAGHPEVNHSLGIETTTGPLGQGLGNSIGMALAERILNAEFGDDLVNHFTYVFAGDGCLMEGISHEAISIAGHLKLRKLIMFFDDNGITIDGPTELSVSDNQKQRFEASHWHVQKIDGHNPQAIEEAIIAAQNSGKPSMIACKTTIGFGSPNKAGTASTHGAPLGEAEVAATRKVLNWPYAPFEIPKDILETWRTIGSRNSSLFQEWQTRLNSHPQAPEFKRREVGNLPQNWQSNLETYKKKLLKESPSVATRKLSEQVLNEIADSLPELVGGSADLTGSNNTKAKSMPPINKDDYGGQYIHYGVREHSMAAIMNGLALHGGIIPFGGTFLVFTDYCRPSIRLSALMKQRVIYIMTHDSIGLGEDGPTHQPIEHLSSLRAIPNLQVFRPADGIETAECWQLALESRTTPSVIALTRQNIPTLRQSTEMQSHLGAYLLQGEPEATVTLIATGSEVSIALDTHVLLQSEGISSKVVSAPCLELFDKQSASYRHSLLGEHSFKVAIEAGSPQPWYKYVCSRGLIIGMNTFGASAPYKDLYEHFGFTAAQISRKIRSYLERVYELE